MNFYFFIEISHFDYRWSNINHQRRLYFPNINFNLKKYSFFIEIQSFIFWLDRRKSKPSIHFTIWESSRKNHSIFEISEENCIYIFKLVHSRWGTLNEASVGTLCILLLYGSEAVQKLSAERASANLRRRIVLFQICRASSGQC